MAVRIVVSLHLGVADPTTSSYLRRALVAKKRAEALGASLAAWGAESFAFDFAPDEVEMAIDLALATFEDRGLVEPRFGAGVAFGEVTRVAYGGGLAGLAWGAPLVAASRLAHAAEPGEVLIDERCPASLKHTVRAQGERRIEGHGEAAALHALVLDTKLPFRRDTLVDALGAGSEGKVRVTVPPLPPIMGLSRELWDRAPVTPVTGERRPSDPPPTLRTEPPPHMPESEPLPPASVSLVSVRSAPQHSLAGIVPPRLPSPRSAPTAPPPSQLAPLAPSSVPPLSASRISWPGNSEEYVELAAAARQALLKGNVAELERLSDELMARGDHGDLAERMAGFVAWNRGAKAEGLRKLRAAADAEVRPAHRVRALLAYGVALAASGRTDAALLAALGAIARAREVSDRQGEHVCARFLARLSSAAGYERAARTWASIADEVGAPRAPQSSSQ